MAKAPVKHKFNTDTNRWEEVKPRTGPTPASNTRKKMRAAAAAKASAPKAAAPKAKTAPVPKSRPKKAAPGGARPEGPAGSMPVNASGATPKGPKGRGGKRGGLYLKAHSGASSYNPKKKLKSSGIAIGGYSLK